MSHDDVLREAEQIARQRDDAENYRLAIAEELLIRFEAANGRRPQDLDELTAWIKAQGDSIEQPVKPSPEAVRRIKQQYPG